MFGHFRLDVRNVFGIAGASLRAALQPAATPGTTIGPVFLAVVDALGRLSPRARMARLGARAFFPRFSRRFLVGRLHARRRGRRLMRLGRQRRLLFGQSLAQPQDHKHGGFRPLRNNLPRLLLGQRTVAQNVQEIVQGNFRARRHAQHTYHITPKSTNTNFRRLRCYIISYQCVSQLPSWHIGATGERHLSNCFPATEPQGFPADAHLPGPTWPNRPRELQKVSQRAAASGFANYNNRP